MMITNNSCVLSNPSVKKISFLEGGKLISSNQKKLIDTKLKVTLITVTYNSDKYLEATIESILNQSYENVEYIIIDGGSTDYTLEIIKRYSKLIDYYVSEKDNGMYDALNKGLKISTGHLIGFCNSDDMLYSNDTICQIVQSYEKEIFDCCYGSVQYIDKKSNVLYARKPLEFKPRYLVTLGLPFAQPAFFWTRELMDKTGCFNLNYKIVSDYDLIGRLLLNSKKVYRIKGYLVKFRKHGHSFGDNNSILALKESLKIKKNFIDRLGMNRFNLSICSMLDRIFQRINQINN